MKDFDNVDYMWIMVALLEVKFLALIPTDTGWKSNYSLVVEFVDFGGFEKEQIRVQASTQTRYTVSNKSPC